MDSITSTLSSSSSGSSAGEQQKRLFITHVDAYGPYLKIFGQLNPDAMAVVRSQMLQILSTCFAIDHSWPLARQQTLANPGAMCLYKNIKGAAAADCELMRARILNTIVQPVTLMLQVEVEFVDYGCTDVLSSYQFFFPQNPEQLQNIPTLCTQYIMLGICKDWQQYELDDILRMIKHQSLDISIQMEFNQFKFMTMKWKQFDFAEYLIQQKKIGAPITNDLLRDNFIKMYKQQQLQQQKLNTTDAHMLSHNNNNTNYYNNKNNINNNTTTYYIANNESNMTVIGSSGANQVREQMAAKRSLSARLHQAQLLPPMHHNVIMHPIQPRMPHSIGNLRSMMHGIHMKNSRLPYTGVPYYQQTAALEYDASVMQTSAIPTMTHVQNFYNPTYQYSSQSLPLNGSSISNASTLHMVATPPPQQQLQQRRSTTVTATFKSNNLAVGSVYDVCVSFVENGPCLFSVQLASAQDELTKMMNQIEYVQLKQFVEKPVLGMACIARYSEDGQLYRALITGVQPSACKVAYIDYGNAELVKYHNLYEIPVEFLKQKAYAIRFTLSGHKELEPIDESLKKAFKDLVIYKNCKLKVMPLEGPPLVQYCELYLQDKDILDVLKQIQKCRLVYAKAEPLQNNDVVEIRYIDSPKHFYVQKISNIDIFELLMDDMYLYYNKNQVVPNHLTLGAPCIVKYENEWYRAEVMRADATAIIVRHVDFGYEQHVTKNLLSTIAEKHLQLPRQAVQCCLKGFENNELNKDLATTQFEMLAEESNRKRRSFTVKVFRIQPDGVNLVNLCTKDLNVMKKLYKLSMPFEQYLTLEKEDFNVHAHARINQQQQKNAENGQKTPSITSSSDMTSVHSPGKKGNMLNSTTLQSDERLQQQQQHQKPLLQPNPQQPCKQTQQQRFPHNTSQTTNSEWDKQSSSASSSKDNRDSRSSSSEHKQALRRQNNQPRNARNLQQQHQLYNMNLDRRSNGSISSGGSHNKFRSANQTPKYENAKIANDQRRQNNQQPQQQLAIPQQQQRAQRPQNAPQGYSQQRQKQNAPSSHRSTDTNSLHSYDSSSNANEQQLQQQQLPPVPEVYVPLDYAFPTQHIETPAREEVVICWWISPHQFYTHLKARAADFERFMRDLQLFYKKKPLQQLQLRVGSHVIARYRKDNILYRARILACNQMLRKYKVLFVDFGSQYTVTSEDIWQVEKRFADFPCMAYLCSFDGIISNYDHLYIIDRMEKYLPAGSTLICDYIEQERDMYYVNVSVNKISLKETLKSDGIITEVCPELHLDLLAGQQIRAKITSIKDMLNFKIQIEGCDIEHIELLCSYDDVRYVKSNPDIAQKFKQFYENKSCVVNIKDVNENKVLLLRPLMPLLREDIHTYICTYPIYLETFKARVVHVDRAYRVYAHFVANDAKVSKLLDALYTRYENGGIPLQSFEHEQICAAKSSDGNWYRARITTANSSATATTIEVYYIDYGNTEKIVKTQLKQLDDVFYNNLSAYAIEINLPLRLLSAADTAQKHKAQKSKTEQNDEVVLNKLKDLTLEHVVQVKAYEMHHNRLLAELITAEDKNVVDLLREQSLIKARDVDYMRKLLDKEKPNMFEYIEMVDLTLEDEDDVEQKPAKHKLKTSSPKKKKPQSSIKSEPKVIDKPVENHVVEQLTKPDETTPAVVKPTVEPEVAAAVPIPAIEKPLVIAESIPTAIVEETKAPTTPASEPQSESESVDPFADMERAALSHCVNPTQFWVHHIDKLDELHKLQENLQIVASSLPPLMRVINGANCISFYSVDKQWYRAKIMDAELMVIQFIDFGNTDWVSDTTDIKEMSVFPDIEPLCIPCALPIRPNGTADWVDAANAIFNDSFEKDLCFEYLTRGENQKRSFINLYIDGVNVTEKLIEDGFAKPLEWVTSGENCYISHVNGLTDFYIQYEKDSKALELIEIYLADNAKLQKLEKFEHGKIVAALFPDDEMWYRAKLLKQLSDQQGYEVLFIDYGNTSISTECREISAEIAKLPSLSKKCALELPAHCLSWSDEAEEKFGEIAALGETIFTVELREPAANHALVYLLIDGHNINDDLESLCARKPVLLEKSLEMNASFFNSSLQTSFCENDEHYSALISHANSPCDFYVQFDKDTIRLEDMTNTLNSLGMDTVTKPAVDQLCAAVYNVDGALYRARILEINSADASAPQYRVLFIDYGNEATTNDIRTLPQDLLQLKSFAKRCELENAERFAQLAGVATSSFETLIADCEYLVKVDILDNEHDPAIVKLYAANTNENLCEKLNKVLGLAAATTISAAPTRASLTNTCLISHAVSPTHFYIQLKANSSKMEVIAKALTKANAEQLPLIDIVEVGCCCVVFVAEDDCYYRGRVERVLANEDASASHYEVLLLDYGNTVNAMQLRELHEELRSIPALAVKCKLNAVPQHVSDVILEEQFTALLEAHFGEVYEIERDELDVETRTHTVKLQVNYKDLAEELAKAVADGPAVVDSFSTQPKLHNCTVIHVNSTASFYVQLSADVSAVEKITDELLDAETAFQLYTEPHVGTICAAQFPEDGAYYRAKIVQLLDGGKCEVHYLDFGNNAVTDQFRQLPESMLEIEAYSKHCALDVNFGNVATAAAACAHFQTLVDSRFCETFQVEFLKTTVEPYICRLFFQDKNVANEVMQLVKESASAAGENNAVSGEPINANGVVHAVNGVAAQ